MANLLTCHAHADLAAYAYLGEAIGSSFEHEQRPSGLVDGYELAYVDGSIMHIPDDGEAVISACQCGGGYVPKRRPATDTLPGGFIGLSVFTAPAYVCDICGYGCECCRECNSVAGCVCDEA